ncbi:Na+/H+ antiporter subunit E [Methylocapsa palsarum]|uniref:Multicomponent Na+:H+ antiporter subunit E n=1 Tax=Methylocapsa palsarum TaxID=1612308 RepID=A0A1I3YXF5_9HYPH|nr:Na+/H+ antiporter subunit E [Methylocapsa palsarum]SFK35876.1 multicomponent Na+:H+ antiporter subunit E [Methylocapsa palsarum]
MTHPGDAAPPRFKGAAAVRAAVFLCFWLMTSGRNLKDLPVGLAAAAAATWTSLQLLPASGLRLRPLALAALLWHFFRQSVISGADVARRALAPRLVLRPGFVICPLRVPPSGRSAFFAFSSLLPGTLPAGSCENGAMIVHCLDTDQPVADNLAAEESLFIKASVIEGSGP